MKNFSKSTHFQISLLILGGLALFLFATASAHESFTLKDSMAIDNKVEEKISSDSTFQCGGTLTDRDGYSYQTVLINNQCWMAENLKSKTKPDGTLLTNLSRNSERDCIGGDGQEGNEADCEAGYTLYTREAAMNNETTENAQGLCPTGWHIPSDSEWHSLEFSLTDEGQTCDPNRPDFQQDCIGAGTKLMIGGDSGFNGLLAGIRYREAQGSQFIGYNNWGYFWSSTSLTNNLNLGRHLENNIPGVYRGSWSDTGSIGDIEATSVRCIQDQPQTFTCGDQITDRDNYTYSTVKIGNQCWTSENLRTKTKPNGEALTNLSNGSQRDCIASNNTRGTETDCAINGALYTWVGAMGVNTLSEAVALGTGAQGICPDDWHIPSNDELTTLERSVCTSTTCTTDFPYGGTVSGLRGTNEGAKLKVGGSSGFNGALVGRREANGITFTSYGTNAWFWSSEYAIPSVYRRQLMAGSNQILRDAGNTIASPRSHSLRCVHNTPAI